MLSDISYRQAPSLLCTHTRIHQVYWVQTKCCEFILRFIIRHLLNLHLGHWEIISGLFTTYVSVLGVTRNLQPFCWRDTPMHKSSGILSDGMPPSFGEAGYAASWIQLKHVFYRCSRNRCFLSCHESRSRLQITSLVRAWRSFSIVLLTATETTVLQPYTYQTIWNCAKWPWPYNKILQCITGGNPFHVVWMETSSTLSPEDLAVSGSVERLKQCQSKGLCSPFGAKKHAAFARIWCSFSVLHIDRVSHARVRES